MLSIMATVRRGNEDVLVLQMNAFERSQYSGNFYRCPSVHDGHWYMNKATDCVSVFLECGLRHDGCPEFS